MKKIILTSSLCFIAFAMHGQNKYFEAEVKTNDAAADTKANATNKIKFLKRPTRGISNLSVASSILSDLSSISLVSSTSETSVTANIGFGRPSNVYNRTIIAPFSGKKTEAVNLDGLAKKSSVSFGWYHEFWKAAKISYNPTDMVNAFKKLDEDRDEKCCKKAETITDYSALSASEKLKMQQMFVYKMNLPFIGFRAKIARNDYDYFSDTTLKITTSSTKYDYEARLFMGYRVTNHHSVALTAIYQNYYDAGDAETYTLPQINGIGKQTELYASAPVSKTRVNVQLEYRSINKSSTFAFNPYLMADFTNSRLEARLQFYIFRQKDDDGNFKGLNGGTFVGYTTGKDFKFDSEKNNFLIGIFFAGAFDVNKY
jgi:hypothetical protein